LLMNGKEYAATKRKQGRPRSNGDNIQHKRFFGEKFEARANHQRIVDEKKAEPMRMKRVRGASKGLVYQNRTILSISHGREKTSMKNIRRRDIEASGALRKT